jgi:pyruvate/2-oxoglutarate dehydrogenase complex dihydrolipoamide dehydrogenase (E3) component
MTLDYDVAVIGAGPAGEKAPSHDNLQKLE